MSIKIENIVPPSAEQWMAVIRGMRNPLNSWEKSDSGIQVDEEIYIGDADLALMQKLTNAGSDHRKFLRMLPVMMDITAPVFWAAEHDTYKVSTVRNSCSFMHRGCAKSFEIKDFSVGDKRIYEALTHKYGTMTFTDEAYVQKVAVWESVLVLLNRLREQYLETKDESIFEEIRCLLPSGYNVRYTWSANYEVLWNIYQARKNHRLLEWREFCETILRKVPYFAEIFGIEAT